MPATITLQGMVAWDNSLFDSLVLPDYDGLDRYDLANIIMLECAELEVLYPEPTFFKQAIYSWSRSRRVPWTHYVNVMKTEYSPIENTDKHETRSIKRDGNETRMSSRKADRSEDGSSSNTINRVNTTIAERDRADGEKTSESYDGHNSTTHDGTTSHLVSAFDTSNFANDTQDKAESLDGSTLKETRVGDKTASSLETDNSRTTNAGEDRATASRKNIDIETGNDSSTRDETETETVHAHGNIGVTTNQQMMQEEVNFWAWDLYAQIAREFRRMFCISVY